MVSDLDLSNFSAAFNIAFAHSAKAMQFLRKLPFPECIPNCQFQLSARSMAASTTIMFLVVSNPSRYIRHFLQILIYLEFGYDIVF